MGEQIQVWSGLEVVLTDVFVERDIPRCVSNRVYVKPPPPLTIIVPAGTRGIVQSWPPGGYPPHLRYTPGVVDRTLVKLSTGSQLWIPIAMLDYANPLEKIARL